MDPITLTIIVLAVGYGLRSLIEDGFAAARGHPAPRIARRAARQQLAHQHAEVTGTPPLTMAISDRLARRVARQPGDDERPVRRAWAAFRAYADEVIADSWEDARTRHQENRQKRERQRRERAAALPGEPEPRDTDSDDDVVDAELVDDTDDTAAEDAQPAPQPAPDPAPDQAPPSTPAPSPASEPLRKDSTPMSQPGTSQPGIINGDVGSPREAVDFCEGSLDLNTACGNEIDVALANLREAGVGQGFLDIVGSVLAAVDEFDSAVTGAREQYARHVVAQADLASDPDLRDTLLGYLSAANA